MVIEPPGYTGYLVHSQKRTNMNTTGKIITAAAIGAAIGAVAGMLFAPHKGSKTRKKICDESKKFTDEVKSAIAKGKEKLSSLKGRYGTDL
jgi:gas vesicle protein